jgi:hypothetical protein
MEKDNANFSKMAAHFWNAYLKLLALLKGTSKNQQYT